MAREKRGHQQPHMGQHGKLHRHQQQPPAPAEKERAAVLEPVSADVIVRPAGRGFWLAGAIAHLADHVPCGWMTTTFLIMRFIHSRLVLWDKHPQAHPVAERKSRIHSNGPIQRTKTHSPSCT
jgi:hypothetical protein